MILQQMLKVVASLPDTFDSPMLWTDIERLELTGTDIESPLILAFWRLMSPTNPLNHLQIVSAE